MTTNKEKDKEKEKRNRKAILTTMAAAAIAFALQWANQGQSLSVKEAAASAVKGAAADMATEKTGRMPASVKHCHDGDTCRIVTEPGHMWMNVRLAGIDAPETSNRRNKSKGQPMGDEATDYVNSNLADKTVEVEQVDLDAYNRPVVVIWNAGKNFNMTLVENGFAEAYRGPVKRIDQSAYIQAESVAKSGKKGIWSLPANVRQSPAEYRKELRQQQKK